MLKEVTFIKRFQNGVQPRNRTTWTVLRAFNLELLIQFSNTQSVIERLLKKMAGRAFPLCRLCLCSFGKVHWSQEQNHYELNTERSKLCEDYIPNLYWLNLLFIVPESCMSSGKKIGVALNSFLSILWLLALNWGKKWNTFPWLQHSWCHLGCMFLFSPF